MFTRSALSATTSFPSTAHIVPKFILFFNGHYVSAQRKTTIPHYTESIPNHKTHFHKREECKEKLQKNFSSRVCEE